MFVTAVLLWLLSGLLFEKIKSRNVQAVAFGYIALAGIANIVVYVIDFIR